VEAVSNLAEGDFRAVAAVLKAAGAASPVAGAAFNPAAGPAVFNPAAEDSRAAGAAAG
jgi:hypothetical protein